MISSTAVMSVAGSIEGISSTYSGSGGSGIASSLGGGGAAYWGSDARRTNSWITAPTETGSGSEGWCGSVAGAAGSASAMGSGASAASTAPTASTAPIASS